MTDEVKTIAIRDVNAAAADVKNIRELMTHLRDHVFIRGEDYDTIPGTKKPSLLQPGMEKILRAMRLRAEFHQMPPTIVDFDKPLFHYEYECRLIEVDTNLCWATAIGSCNSMESKYRWREGKRVCPHCHQETIFKSKDAGQGWFCWYRKGGCGATYPEGDPSIEGQMIGKVANEDIFDQVNTLQKMAQKRALGSAVKTVSGVSMFFTVDIEETTPEGRAAQEAQRSRTQGQGQEQPQREGPPKGSSAPEADLSLTDNRVAFFDWLKKEKGLDSKKAMEALKTAGYSNLKGVQRLEALAALFPDEYGDDYEQYLATLEMAPAQAEVGSNGSEQEPEF